jgi:Peptidase C13 family
MRILWNTSYWLRLSLLALLLLLQACATSPYSSENKARSDAWLDQQLAKLKAADTLDSPPRLFILSAALHDQSKAFRGDVEGFTTKISDLHKNAFSVRLANPTIGQAADLPYATRENLDRVVKQMAASMRSIDRAVVMLTTHGNVNVLGVNAGGQAFPSLSGQNLRSILSPLERFDHGIVISACYSGSLIPALRHESRWIMTAASAERASFGCQFSGTQTYFMQALLGQPITADKSLKQWHEQAKKSVTEREQREKLSPSSDPQIFLSRKFPESITIGTALGL